VTLNIESLWIGDTVQIISTGQIGKYHGHERGQVKVKCQKEILMVSPDDIVLYEEPALETPLVFDEIKTQKKIKISSSLDLHIEKLAPEMRSQLPARIRDYQLTRARQYIEQTIAMKKAVVTIIHGKGTGALKSEIVHMLSLIPEVRFTFERNNGGATEVWLK